MTTRHQSDLFDFFLSPHIALQRLLLHEQSIEPSLCTSRATTPCLRACQRATELTRVVSIPRVFYTESHRAHRLWMSLETKSHARDTSVPRRKTESLHRIQPHLIPHAVQITWSRQQRVGYADVEGVRYGAQRYGSYSNIMGCFTFIWLHYAQRI